MRSNCAPWIKEAQSWNSRDAPFAMVSDTHKLPARGPMPWNDTENNGFTSAKPWLNGISQDDVTVANEVNSDNSMFTFYKNMLNLKKEKLFQDGTYYMISTGKDSLRLSTVIWGKLRRRL